MPTVLITGANRGLGLEHVRQYAEQGWTVHACARDPDKALSLQSLARTHPELLSLHRLDVTDHAAIDALAASLAGEPIDVLLNNAGTYGPQGSPEGLEYQSLAKMDYGIWRNILEVNLLAPFKIAVAFHSNLACSQKQLLVMVSSGLASIEDNIGHSYAYRSSKVGLNMLTKGMAAEWSDVTVVAIAPGWCKTDLGGADALLEPAESVRDQQALFETLTQDHSGQYLDQHGNVVPW